MNKFMIIGAALLMMSSAGIAQTTTPQTTNPANTNGTYTNPQNNTTYPNKNTQFPTSPGTYPNTTTPINPKFPDANNPGAPAVPNTTAPLNPELNPGMTPNNGSNNKGTNLNHRSPGSRFDSSGKRF